MPRIIPRKRWKRVLLALVVLLVIGWFMLPQLFVPMIRAKLEAMLASHLAAEVRIGQLSYWPPYGLRARDVSVVAHDPKHGSVEVFRVKVLDLKLAKLPFGEGPLVFQNITLRRPEVHVVLADGGVVGRGHVVRGDDDADEDAKEDGDTGKERRPRLSEMFLLRHFGMEGGQVIVENRDVPGSPPMIWNALDIEMQTVPKSGSEYDFGLETADGGVADMSIQGAFDLDALWVNLTRLHIDIAAGETGQEALPPQIQSLLNHHELAGRVTLDATGRLFLRDMPASEFSGSLKVVDASGAFPEHAAAVERLNALLGFSRRPRGAEGSGATEEPLHVWVDRFEIETGQDRFTLSAGRFHIDRVKGRWSTGELLGRLQFDHPEAVRSPGGRRSLFGLEGAAGHVDIALRAGGALQKDFLAGIDLAGLSLSVRPQDARILPPRFDVPLDRVTGEIKKPTGTRVMLLRNLSVRYGQDRIEVDRARMILPENARDLRDAFWIKEITGVIDFGRPATPYPGKFGKVVADLSPEGPFNIGGGSWFARRTFRMQDEENNTIKRRRNDYYFSISSDRGAFHLLEGRLPVTALRGDATVSPLSVNIEHLHGELFGGTLTGTFHVTPKSPKSYAGDISVRDIDLHALGESFELPPSQRDKLAGRGFANASFAGLFNTDERPFADTLEARGEFEIFGGHLWTLPVFNHVAERTSRGTPLTMGEAAGRFVLADRVIDFKSIAVSSPALGLQGSGTVGLDQSLDLKVIAAPLGDWRERVQRGNVPIVSDVAGEVLGAVQQVLNAATSTLLFEFRVTGSTADPNVETVPVPALTDPIALLFAEMLRDPQDRRWADNAKKEQ